MTCGKWIQWSLALAVVVIAAIIAACANSVAMHESASAQLDTGASVRGLAPAGTPAVVAGPVSNYRKDGELLIIPRDTAPPASTVMPPAATPAPTPSAVAPPTTPSPANISGGVLTPSARGAAGSRGGGGGAGGAGTRGNAGGGRGTIAGRGRGAAPAARGPATQPNTQFETPQTPEDLIPGSPILVTQAEGKLVPVPLQHTDVSAQITGYIASVQVTQNYANPYAEKIEAVYVFPLPENAGINDFVMTIGERQIRGIIRERAEAERIYAEARAQGYVASMMSQERPNIFTQKVANIEPGKKIDISIKYFHTLSYQDGWFEWVFPMVVGPRYNPAGSTDGVGAVARNARGASGQSTEIQYLHPTERSGHDIALKVDVDAGVSIEQLLSVNHKIRQQDTREHSLLVQLDPADSLPNKDFVLRFKVAGNRPKTGLFVQRNEDGNGGYFTLLLIPPEDLKSLPRRGVEMVFVVDTSGSMSGAPIAQAKAAVQVALSKMDPSDTFQVVKFASGAEQMAPSPMDANPQNLLTAQTYVAAMSGNGGTEMMKGINAALDFPHDENRTRVVAFLTDGYIGNEIQILRALHAKLQESRVFSFGVGSSPNRYLMDAMARLGHGNAAYLSLNDAAEPVMNTYFDRISHPALTNLKVNFGGDGMKVTDVYPQRLPELFVGRPVIITGRYTGSLASNITITGRVGEQQMTFTLPTRDAIEENPAIATVWARMKIADLHDEAIYEGRDVSTDVKQTALTYGLVSDYTSFLAVDSSRRTEGTRGTTVSVPVPVPDGVRYETTVQEVAPGR